VELEKMIENRKKKLQNEENESAPLRSTNPMFHLPQFEELKIILDTHRIIDSTIIQPNLSMLDKAWEILPWDLSR